MENSIAKEQANVEESRQPRVFISYKRTPPPKSDVAGEEAPTGLLDDEKIALTLTKAFEEKNFNVFIDVKMRVGTIWAERIETELRTTDFLVVLLSASSVKSEMVKGEITTAHHISQKQNGMPRILPVRLKYREPFQYPLSAYLDPINWAFWENDNDTESLIEELSEVIAGRGELKYKEISLKEELIWANGKNDFIEPLADAQPIVKSLVALGSPEEPQDPQSEFYIKRKSDTDALKEIQAPTATITIKGPEQIGKSSLLFQTLIKAEEAGKKVAFLDFQLFDESALADRNKFYTVFCKQIGNEIGVEDKTEEFWKQYGSQGNVMACTFYMRDHLLRALGDKTLVLAIDEVESIFHCSFRNEFLKMLRLWHGNRGDFRYRMWRRLNMIFAISTEPYDLMTDVNSSPFNVTPPITISDFSVEQVKELNKLHGLPLGNAELEKLMKLLCGQPYLVRRALYLLATGSSTSDELFRTAADDYGPFGDHLRYHLFKLRGKEELIAELKQIINHQKPLNENAFHLLRGAGLVQNEFQNGQFRCQLYKDFFGRHLNGSSGQ